MRLIAIMKQSASGMLQPSVKLIHVIIMPLLIFVMLKQHAFSTRRRNVRLIGVQPKHWTLKLNARRMLNVNGINQPPPLNAILINVWPLLMKQVVKQIQPVNGNLTHVRSSNANSIQQELNAVLMLNARGTAITVVLTIQSNVQVEEFLNHLLHRELFLKSLLSRKYCSDKLNVS